MKKVLIIIFTSLISTGTMIFIGVYFGLDILEKISTIIGSLSLVVAVATYFYQKKQDQTLAAIDQITFFREKIIGEWENVLKKIQGKKLDYWFSRITINGCSIDDIKKDYSHNFQTQISIFIDNFDKDPNQWITDQNILNAQITLLNMLEEFSLRVNHFKTQKHSALESVRATFVELIEKNAVALFYMRDIISSDNQTYSVNLRLYNLWKDKVNKSNVFNNLQKHGFITKEEMNEILKRQRELRTREVKY